MQPAVLSLLKRYKAKLALLLALLILATTSFLPGSAPLYAQGNGNPAAAGQSGIAQSVSDNQQVATVVYVVKRGDTLGAIARTYKTTIPALMQLNPQIRNPNRLFVGQRIRVPAPAQEPGEPAGFTITKIHLISLNDGGSIGCGDTLVPVTVEIPATRAVLRASLEKLLSLKTQFYGESGLYNALYQSQLTIDDVRIDNRVATIRLSGQIVQGGVCDAPRIQAQLEQAALQFSTVSSVKIYVNGNSMQGLLSEK